MQTAVDTQHHLIVAHEVTNVGSNRDQLSSMAKQAREAMASETLSVVADRGYFKSEEILACHDAGITAYVPKPMTSGAKADGRFNNDAFIYDAAKNEYICPAGETLTWRYTNVEKGLTLHRYHYPWPNAGSASIAIGRATTFVGEIAGAPVKVLF